jgi:hypothetical protein
VVSRDRASVTVGGKRLLECDAFSCSAGVEQAVEAGARRRMLACRRRSFARLAGARGVLSHRAQLMRVLDGLE